MAFLERISNISTFIFDMDGVLTDGSLITSLAETDYLRTFNAKDGYALQLAIKKGYEVIIISGGKSVAAKRRFTDLGIKHVYMSVPDKQKKFEEIQKTSTNQLKLSEILYMGDDLPDLNIMQTIGKEGIAACPSDAATEIKTIASYISPFIGGKGCVRDIIEKVLRAKDEWSDM